MLAPETPAPSTGPVAPKGTVPAPTPTTTAPTTATTGTTTTADKSAIDEKAMLAPYGLQGLAEWAWEQWKGGISEDALWLQIRQRPEYKIRFPAMEELAKQGNAITEANYIIQEVAYKKVMHAYGLPLGFYDSPDDFGEMISGHVSAEELGSRVQVFSTAVLGDTETLNQLRTLYADQGVPGSAESDLLAYYLDPDRALPILEMQYSAARFSAAAAKSGYGQLSASQAEQFGARPDIDPRIARVGFEELTRGKELFEALPGQGEQRIGQDVQLGAVAFGQDALRVGELGKRAEQRRAAGSGGGQFSQSRTGAAAGLSSNEI